MDFLISIKKRVNYLFSSKSAILSVCIAAITCLASCKSSKWPHTNNAFEQLHTLYLEKSDLKTLLTATNGTDKADSMVFQYFYDKKGVLTLEAWAVKGQNCDYGHKPLKVSTKVDASLTGKNVGLGNLSFNKSTYKMLLDSITKYPNNPNYNFFIFTPSITRDSRTKLNNVAYKMRSSSSPNKFLQGQGIDIDLNPCPPHCANESN